MRIKKTSNTRALAGKVVNIKSESTTDAYSCDYINDKINDTGWKVATLKEGFTSGSLASEGNLMYRRIGNLVYTKGSLSGFTAFSQTCATLPVGYRPPTRIDAYGSYSGTKTANFTIGSNGNIGLVNNRDNNVSSDQWYALCTSWITDDAFPSS